MRTITFAERERQKGDVNYHQLIEVQNGSGTWVDLGNLGGVNWIEDGFVEGGVDVPVMNGVISLKRETDDFSLAPLMGGSTLNRDDANNYSPVLYPGRGFRWRTATTLRGVAPVAADWKWVVSGKIDRVDWKSDPAQIEFRDLGAKLQDTYIEIKRPYNTAANQSLEGTIQQILNDNMGVGTYTVTVLGSTGAALGPFTQDLGNVMEAIRTLAQLRGLNINYMYDAADNFLLTLYAPDRAQTTADDSIGPNEYFDVDGLSISDSDVRNVVSGLYVSSVDGKVYERLVSDATSISQFGRKWMQIGTDLTFPIIQSASETDTLINAALSDLKTPYADQAIINSFMWQVQYGDMYNWLANGVHYDSDQIFAVIGFRHEFNQEGMTTSMITRGKPAGSYRTWLKKFGNTDLVPDDLALLEVTPTFFATTASLAWSGNGVITLSIDGGAFTTPSSSPIVVSRNPEGGVEKVYTFRAILGDQEVFNTIVIPPIGVDTVSPDLTVKPSTPATLTQSFTVTAVNPKVGGAAPVIRAEAVGCAGTATAPGGAVTNIVDGAASVVIVTGSVVQMTRPVFGAPSGSIFIEATLTGGGRESISARITPRQAIGPNLVITPTPFGTSYSLLWTGDGVTLSIDGGAYATPPASPIVVTRPAIGQPDKIYTFKGVLDGQTVTNSVTIPAIGSPETPNLSVVQGAQTDTTQIFTASATAPGGGTPPVITVFFTDCTAVGVADGATLTNPQSITVNRPSFAGKKPGSVRFRATIGTSYEEIIRTVSAQVQVSFGPSLTVNPTAYSTYYSMLWSGDSVTVDTQDGNGFVTPATNPLVMNRNAVGGVDKTATFRGVKDGQTVTNSITVPAVGAPDTPNLNIVQSANDATTTSYVVTGSSPGGASPSLTVWLTGTATFASAHYSGGPVTSGDTVVINKPPFGDQPGSVRFRAAVGSSFEEIIRTVTTSIKTSFGPTLDFSIVEYADRISITWNGAGATVEAVIDNGSRYTPSNPEVVYRNGAGGNTKQITFFATKDGQMVPNTISVPPVGRWAPTLDIAVTEYSDRVSIAFNGDGATVTIAIDAGSPVAAFSPEVVYRNAAGGAPKNVTMRTTRDGTTSTNTIVVPPAPVVLPPRLTDAYTTANYDSGTGDQTITANFTAAGASDAGQDVKCDMYKNGVFRGTSTVEPSTGIAEVTYYSGVSPGSDKFHCVVNLTGGGAASSITTPAVDSTY